jgi:rubrerythrin
MSDDAGASPANELCELLRLEQDAARAYAAALEHLGTDAYRAAVERFIDEHTRHIDELTRLVRGYGGRSAEPIGAPPGPFERAVRAVDARGGDAAILATLKRGERAGRDRYRRAVRPHHGPEIAAVLRRAANDEAAHYSWTLEALDDLAAAEAAARAERLLDGLATRLGYVSRAVRFRANAAAGGATRELRGEIGYHPMRAALVALVVGLAAAVVVGARTADSGGV